MMVDMTQRSGTAPAGDLEICYDEFGDVDAPPVLLIMGLGAQMVYWREGFCQQIADAIRVKNGHHHPTREAVRLRFGPYLAHRT